MHRQVQVAGSRVVPPVQLVTQLPPHSVVPLGQPQVHVLGLRTRPPVQLVTQAPPHNVCPLGQPQVQVLLLKDWPAGQAVETQLPPHNVCPLGQPQVQVLLLKVWPLGQRTLTQTPLQAWKPDARLHSQRLAPVVPTVVQTRFWFGQQLASLWQGPPMLRQVAASAGVAARRRPMAAPAAAAKSPLTTDLRDEALARDLVRVSNCLGSTAVLLRAPPRTALRHPRGRRPDAAGHDGPPVMGRSYSKRRKYQDVRTLGN
jgi:hypothetical protein